ncbi:hypothetical protein CVT26_001540, partial [Gymnopilus dilepis]
DLSRPVRCSDVTVPPLSEPAWPIDETLDTLNKNLADILARPPPSLTLHTSTSTLAPAQYSLPQQNDIGYGYQHGAMAFNGSHAIDIAEIIVHPETINQQRNFDHDGTVGQSTSSEPRLVERQQTQVDNHGQSSSSQYSLQSGFQVYKSESGLDQALVQVQSSAPTAVTAVPQPVATASSQTSQESFQPYGGGSSLDMALVERPSPASTVVSTHATAPTSTSTSHAPSMQSAPASTVPAQPATTTATLTNNAPSSHSVEVPARKRKSRPDEASNAAASSSSAPRKKRKPTPSSTKPREPPRPRYFPSTSSYRRIKSQPPATTPEYGEHYQRLPRDPNASVYDMLGIPTSVGRPGSRHGPFGPGSKED